MLIFHYISAYPDLISPFNQAITFLVKVSVFLSSKVSKSSPLEPEKVFWWNVPIHVLSSDDILIYHFLDEPGLIDVIQ